MEERALTAATLADDRDEASLADMKIDALQYGHDEFALAVALFQAAGGE